MKDGSKTKAQLLEELAQMRHRVTASETLEEERQRAVLPMSKPVMY